MTALIDVHRYIAPYSDSLALTLMEHAAMAYRLPHQFARWALDRHDGSTIIERWASQIGIAFSPAAIIVAARGSSEKIDWLENALAFRWPWRWVPSFEEEKPEERIPFLPVGGVHAGFQLQGRRVQEEFRDIMRALRAKYPAAPVYVTGHSLGAALCPFLARMLEVDRIPVEAVYTFEAPRAMNTSAAFWWRVNGPRTFRVVCVRRGCADLVTRIPPSAWGWRHVGERVMIVDGWRDRAEAAWEDLRKANPVEPLSSWRIISRVVTTAKAHLAGKLVEDLRGIAERAVEYAACTAAKSTGG